MTDQGPVAAAARGWEARRAPPLPSQLLWGSGQQGGAPALRRRVDAAGCRLARCAPQLAAPCAWCALHGE
jgi:hypothetical protein